MVDTAIEDAIDEVVETPTAEQSARSGAGTQQTAVASKIIDSNKSNAYYAFLTSRDQRSQMPVEIIINSAPVYAQKPAVEVRQADKVLAASSTPQMQLTQEQISDQIAAQIARAQKTQLTEEQISAQIAAQIALAEAANQPVVDPAPLAQAITAEQRASEVHILRHIDFIDALNIDPNDRDNCFRSIDKEFYNRCSFGVELDACTGSACDTYRIPAGQDVIIARDFDAIKAVRPFSIGAKSSYPYQGQSTPLFESNIIAPVPAAVSETVIPHGYVQVDPSQLYATPTQELVQAVAATAPVVTSTIPGAVFQEGITEVGPAKYIALPNGGYALAQ